MRQEAPAPAVAEAGEEQLGVKDFKTEEDVSVDHWLSSAYH
jgi:hypothetical protein